LAATAEEMSGQAEQLQQTMSFFKLDSSAGSVHLHPWPARPKTVPPALTIRAGSPPKRQPNLYRRPHLRTWTKPSSPSFEARPAMSALVKNDRKQVAAKAKKASGPGGGGQQAILDVHVGWRDVFFEHPVPSRRSSGTPT
jgi:hypothetical protein